MMVIIPWGPLKVFTLFNPLQNIHTDHSFRDTETEAQGLHAFDQGHTPKEWQRQDLNSGPVPGQQDNPQYQGAVASLPARAAPFQSPSHAPTASRETITLEGKTPHQGSSGELELEYLTF